MSTEPPSGGYRYVIFVLGFLNIAASIGLARFAYTVVMPLMRDSRASAWARPVGSGPSSGCS